MENIILNSIDGYKLSLNVYHVDNAKGYIQIIHGMQEHQNRYINIINYLNERGYTVISSDMRGHGKNAKDLGFFAEKKGFKLLLEDQKEITKYIQERFKSEKVTILAHSMGTIITRNLLQTESKNYDKVILSGYPNYQFAVKLGILVGKLIRTFKGSHHNSKLLHNLSVGSFNKKIKNPRTNLDWLSYDCQNIDKYIADPLCGFPFKTSAFIDLFTLLNRMNNQKLYKDINDLPILLLAGNDDPCTGGEKGTNKSMKVLNKVGFNDTKKIDLPNMRHEIFNEKEHMKVFDEIKEFLK